ncbi:MAG TPA: hypothetical protein VG795_14425, partial [Acidimicrobiia bacterium]|nr:hypothetical protein [Acidimicrobiia bacterium]
RRHTTAVDYARRAGDRALAQLAHDEAAMFYRQALDLLSAGAGIDQRRINLLISLGEAQRRAGDPRHRETLLEAARLADEAGDGAALARAALANTRVLHYTAVGRVDADRIAVLERGLESIGDVATRTRLLASLGLELLWEADRRRRVRLSDEALATARGLGDRALLADVLLARFYTIASPATLAERLSESGEVLAIADELHDPMRKSRGLVLRVRAALEAGDSEEVDRCIRENEQLAKDLSLPAVQWVVTLHRAGRALLAGHIEQAEAVAPEIVELGEAAGQPDAWSQSVVLLLQVRFEQGRMSEIEHDLARVYHETGMRSLRAILAVLYCETGRDADARSIFEDFFRGDYTIPEDMVWLRGTTELAAVCAHLHDTARADILYQRLLPYVDHFPTVLYGGLATGSVAHYVAVLATTQSRFDEAEHFFTKASSLHDHIGAPTWQARTRLEWARMLFNRGQPGGTERARVLLGQALASARELGLAKVERDTVALLQECG